MFPFINILYESHKLSQILQRERREIMKIIKLSMKKSFNGNYTINIFANSTDNYSIFNAFKDLK